MTSPIGGHTLPCLNLFLALASMLSLPLAMQVPKRLYTLEELRLNDVRPEEFLSPEDSTLNTVRTVLQVKSGSCLLFTLLMC